MLAVNFLVNLKGGEVCRTAMGGDVGVGLLLTGVGGAEDVPVFNGEG